MGDGETMYCFLTDSENHVTSKEMTLVTADPTTPDRKLLVLRDSRRWKNLHRGAILRNG